VTVGVNVAVGGTGVAVNVAVGTGVGVGTGVDGTQAIRKTKRRIQDPGRSMKIFLKSD
jgi:hypothetical protein